MMCAVGAGTPPMHLPSSHLLQHIPGAPGTSSKEWGAEAVERMSFYARGLVSFTVENAEKDLGLRRDKSRRIDLNFKTLVKDVPSAITRACISYTRPLHCTSTLG